MPRRAQLSCRIAISAPGRRGMTLVEVLLTLTLLVVIGSLVAPVFVGAYSTVRLRGAGNLVVAQWSNARAQAVEKGEVYQFRFTPNTGTFVIGSWTGLIGGSVAAGGPSTAGSTTTTTTATASTSVTGADNAASSSAASTTTTTNVALPEEIIFQSGELAVDEALTGEQSVGTLQQENGSLSTPILFFPDGTTSQASVVLTNGKQQFVRVTLRGLTGVARASALMTQEELQRADRRK